MENTPETTKLRQRARKLFVEKGYLCSEAVLAVMCEHMVSLGAGEKILPAEYLRIASGFGGGLGAGDACGALCGGVMALSMLVAFESGAATMEEKKALKGIYKDFREFFAEANGSIECRELTARFESFDSPERKAQCADIVEATVEELAARFKELAACPIR